MISISRFSLILIFIKTKFNYKNIKKNRKKYIYNLKIN